MKRLKLTPEALLRPGFQASVRTDGALELMIYGQIVTQSQLAMMEMFGYPTDGMVSAMSVKNALDRTDSSFSKIVVRINSPGGNAFEGIAIGNLLKATGKPIQVYVDAVAASAASIVAMCGDTTMAKNSMMMFHNAWTDCEGYASDMRKMADTLDTISASIGQTYAAKTGKSLEEITALMDAETWMGAEECVKNGFAAAVAKDENLPAMAMARGFKALNYMKRVPESLKPEAKAAAAPKAENSETEVCECPCQPCADGDCAHCTNSSCDDENCVDCPMQAGEENNTSNLNLFQARQWETEHGLRA